MIYVLSVISIIWSIIGIFELKKVSENHYKNIDNINNYFELIYRPKLILKCFIFYLFQPLCSAFIFSSKPTTLALITGIINLLIYGLCILVWGIYDCYLYIKNLKKIHEKSRNILNRK